MQKLRMLSLCSGIGGADLAAEWTNQIEVIGQVEINPFCQKVLTKHWPQVKRLDDIREVQGDEFGAIDIMVGGIPCQPFSSAGQQRGKEDDRYLWPEMLRIVTRAHPAWLVIENVDDFAYMALDIAQADLESQDYAVQAFVLPACATGATHIRERCFVVAYSSGDRQRLRQDQPQRQRTRQETSDTSIHGTQGVVAHPKHWRRERWMLDENQPGATVLCGNAGTRAELEPGMGRVFDGISSRLDSILWPSMPGREQQAWEPQRVVFGKVPERAKRLEALGNAIVPYQIYPFFAGIVEWEQTMKADKLEKL
jgi:DNA (cytosine-5)-methyltransferase 1